MANVRGDPVHAVDLLGEPGRSTQTAHIRDGADQAAWPAATHAISSEDGVLRFVDEVTTRARP